jgi:hypothetical protein
MQGDRKGRSLGDCVAPTILDWASRSCMVGAGFAPALLAVAQKYRDPLSPAVNNSSVSSIKE